MSIVTNDGSIMERAKYKELSSQLAAITQSVADIENGAPAAVFATTTALGADATANTADGKRRAYVVTADGKWYYWNGSAWAAGGTYQATAIADGAITGAKLAAGYNYKAYLNSSNDLNQVVAAGVYITNTVTNLPLGVSGFATLEVIQGQDRWVIQKLYVFATPHIIWIRKIDASTFTPTTWVKTINDVTDVKTLLAASKLTKDHINPIDKTFLSTSFCDRGVANIDEAVEHGVYTVNTSGGGTWPSDFGTDRSGTLTVSVVSNRWVVQYLHDINSATGRFYVREIDNYSGAKVIRAWKKVFTGELPKPLSNQTVHIFGDSLTNGAWEVKAATITGMTNAVYGITGTCLSTSTDARYDALSMTRLADAIVSDDWTAVDAAVTALAGIGQNHATKITALKAVDFSTQKYALMFFGANDFGANHVPIGVNTDNGYTTFKGGINHVIDTLQTAYPNLQLIFISPCCSFTAGVETINADGLAMSDYVDALIEVCGKNHVPCYDLHRNCGINVYNQTTLTSDGLHPNATGQALIGGRIAAWINSNFSA